ncbi:MAG TPA: hypothetical protein VHG08_26385 [Longimicrobium sp.]|nr:hypothetical protein [Longimicrobium sp.]
MVTAVLPAALLFLLFVLIAVISTPRWLGYAAAGRVRIGSGALFLASPYAITPVLVEECGSGTLGIHGEALAFAVSLFGGVILLHHGRSNLAAARSATAATRTGPRMLYLRPFRTDGRIEGDPPAPRGESRSWSWRLTAPIRLAVQWWVRLPHLTFSRFVRRTFPDRLAHALRRAGSIELVGTRSLDRMEPGPARVPAEGADWKEDVHRRLQRAEVVILHIGTSGGVRWELKDAVDTVRPTAFLLHVPIGYTATGRAAARAQYQEFKAATIGLFPKPLPDYVDGAQFVYFELDWTPRLLVPVWPGFRRINQIGANGEQARILRLLSSEFAPSRLRVMLEFCVVSMLLLVFREAVAGVCAR